MATLAFSMNASLDGYVDHEAFGPTPELFRHFIAMTERTPGSLYGRRLYEVMRTWDEDGADWGEAEWAFARAWRRQPKWVVSRTLAEVGPNATLHRDLVPLAQRLKAEVEGEIDVGGRLLAASLAEAELLDAWHIYLHPVVLGAGTPLFPGPRPRLRLLGTEAIGDILRLTYAP